MKLINILIFILVPLSCFSQGDSIRKRIVLIGDAGGLVNGRAVVIDAVRRLIPMDNNTVVIFPGDNLYGRGLPDEQYSTYSALRSVLDSQVALVKNTKAKAYFIPGNHDWANGDAEGWETVIRQQLYIDQISKDNVKFYPEYGCPGPVEVPITDSIVLIIMDSQWWLHRNDRPGIESDCNSKTTDEVLNVLEDMIEKNSKKLIFFACHHPFKSTGPHSGYFGLRQHLFPFTDIKKNLYIPLPLLGSIYPISRSVFGSPQDLKFPTYQNMVAAIDDVLKEHPYVVHLHGHEHSLQLISDSSYHYIISGSGCKKSRVNKNKKVKYSAESLGFAVVEILKNKDVNVKFYEVDAEQDSVTMAYSENLLNYSTFPPLAEDTITVHEWGFKDTVEVAINKKYDTASALKRLITGDNYRTEWATPVRFRVFNIKKEMGGFRITGIGGGKQSKSLRLTDKNGKEWALRSLNKDPEKAIPKNFRGTFAASIVKDMISASHPYGCLVVPPLAEALRIPHSKPRFYFVPNDYALGYYRPVFANTVCMLEEHEPAINKKGAKSTDKMFNKLVEDNDKTVNQELFLRARLLDFLIGDFDRHEGQWKWGETDTGKRKIFYPIPKDRDQALFYSDGWLLKGVTMRLMPYLKGFRYTISKPRWIGFTARDLDRMYLNELDAEKWKQGIREFNTIVSDSLINRAIAHLPSPIAEMDSEVITKKLKARRDLLPKKAMIYYRYIAKRVNVVGSNSDEYFHITQAGDDIQVSVYALGSEKDSVPLYSRKFDPKVTQEIRLFGLHGNDMFKSDENVSSKIKVTLVGGKGVDTFDMRGRMQSYLYDLKTSPNIILSAKKTKNRMSKDPEVNSSDIQNYNYDVLRFPRIRMGYNPEDNFMVGVGLWYRTYGFRKAPYSSDQKFSSLFSPSNGANQLRYNGEFINMIGKTDLVFNGFYVNPALNNFFGLGNETTKDSGQDMRYYRVRFKYITGNMLFRKRYFSNRIGAGIGPSFFYYWDHAESNTGRILGNAEKLGIDTASIYSPKAYGGGKLAVRVNNLNDDLFPTRGVDWVTEFDALRGMNDNSKPYTKLQSDMAVYASLSDPARVVAVLHLGAGKILSRQFEYFQAMTLGANNYLRGFRKNRFAGSSMAYASIELRVKLFDIRSYLIPGGFGIVAFNDAGRVWQKGESSGKLHNSYGGGLYFTPYNKVIFSATTAFSGEEALFNFTIGTKINLTF